MSTHTPGPWRVAPSVAFRGSLDIDGPVGHGHVASTYCLPTDEECANARLIAAAPDLLAALVRLREWVRHPGRDDSPENEAVIDQAEAAIARAKGEGK